MMDEQDSSVMAVAFIEILDDNNIPFKHYAELYQRAVGLRASRLANGLKCEDFSADLMVGCWAGLAKDIHDRDVRSGKYLPDAVATDCESCFGTGMWNPDGQGTRSGCPHPRKEGNA